MNISQEFVTRIFIELTKEEIMEILKGKSIHGRCPGSEPFCLEIYSEDGDEDE